MNRSSRGRVATSRGVKSLVLLCIACSMLQLLLVAYEDFVVDAADPGHDTVARAWRRDWLEFCVVAFQVEAAISMGLWRLCRRPWSRIGLAGFFLALVGLGLSGAGCAGVNSPFALYAGGWMAALLVLNVMEGTGRP